MRALIVQISALIGVITFLSHLWNNASLERTLLVSLGVGVAIYIVLMAGNHFIQQILTKNQPPVPEDAKVTKETTANAAGQPAPKAAQA